jgi:hypothetical protein
LVTAANRQHQPAEEVHPVRQRVEPRERHVARADLQRHDVVEEGGRQRHQRQEDHRQRVLREHLVVRVRADEVVLRHDELRADEQRLDPPTRK